MINQYLKLAKSPYWLLLILALINLILVFTVVKTPLQGNGDLPSYLEAMNFLQDKPYGEDFMINRVLTSPLMLYSSIFFGQLVGSERTGMLIVNILFYFLIVFVFYKIVELIYQNRKAALLASILFLANYCMFNYGTTYRVDMAGWFFFLLASLFAVKYYQSRLTDKKALVYSVLAAALGVLFKENGVLGLISLGFLILFSSVAFKEKAKKILGAGALFVIIPGLYYLYFYLKYNYSYFDWYFQNVGWYVSQPETAASEYGLFLLIKVLGWLFLVGWPIFLWGIYQEYKEFNKERIKILLALLPASLTFLAWPAMTQRIAFVFVPWLVLIAGFGLAKIRNKYIIVIILLIYVLVNYLTRPWLLSAINI